MLQTPTCPEVHGGIEPLQGPALQELFTGPIGGEEQHVVAQVAAEALKQETQVVIVTGEVATIFIFYLQIKKEEEEKHRRPQGGYSSSSFGGEEIPEPLL